MKNRHAQGTLQSSFYGVGSRHLSRETSDTGDRLDGTGHGLAGASATINSRQYVPAQTTTRRLSKKPHTLHNGTQSPLSQKQLVKGEQALARKAGRVQGPSAQMTQLSSKVNQPVNRKRLRYDSQFQYSSKQALQASGRSRGPTGDATPAVGISSESQLRIDQATKQSSDEQLQSSQHLVNIVSNQSLLQPAPDQRTIFSYSGLNESINSNQDRNVLLSSQRLKKEQALAKRNARAFQQIVATEAGTLPGRGGQLPTITLNQHVPQAKLASLNSLSSKESLDKVGSVAPSRGKRLNDSMLSASKDSYTNVMPRDQRKNNAFSSMRQHSEQQTGRAAYFSNKPEQSVYRRIDFSVTKPQSRLLYAQDQHTSVRQAATTNRTALGQAQRDAKVYFSTNQRQKNAQSIMSITTAQQQKALEAQRRKVQSILSDLPTEHVSIKINNSTTKQNHGQPDASAHEGSKQQSISQMSVNTSFKRAKKEQDEPVDHFGRRQSQRQSKSSLAKRPAKYKNLQLSRQPVVKRDEFNSNADLQPLSTNQLLEVESKSLERRASALSREFSAEVISAGNPTFLAKQSMKDIHDLKERHDLTSNVSIFTMAENKALQKNLNFVIGVDNPHEGHQPARCMRNEAVQQAKTDPALALALGTAAPSQIRSVSCAGIIKKNDKELKTLQFQLKMLVSSGIQHEVIPRFRGRYTRVDIVEGTFQLFKIETRKLQAPLRIVIRYVESSAEKRDLRVIYSRTIPKPEVAMCDGSVDSPSVIMVDSQEERYFTKEFLYLKFETVTGCVANVKAVFPKQDHIDLKFNKAQQAGQGGSTAVVLSREEAAHNQLLSAQQKFKSKVKKDIEFQVHKLMTEPRLYENFLVEFKALKEQRAKKALLKSLRSRKGSAEECDSALDEYNFVMKNTDIETYLERQLHKKQGSRERTQSKIADAKTRRKQLEERDRKQKVLNLSKWDIVRAKEKEMTTQLESLKLQISRMQIYIAHVALRSCLATIYHKFEDLKEKKIMMRRRMTGAILFKVRCRIYVKRFGKQLDKRIRRFPKLAMNLFAAHTHKQYTLQARSAFVWFLRAAAEKYEKTRKVREFFHLVGIVQTGWKRIKRVRAEREVDYLEAWRKFFVAQRTLAQKQDLAILRKQKASSKNAVPKEDAQQASSELPAAIKSRHFELVTQEATELMLRTYIRLRELDQSYQLLIRYEMKNQATLSGQDREEHEGRKEKTLVEIYKCLDFCGLPLVELKTFMKQNALGGLELPFLFVSSPQANGSFKDMMSSQDSNTSQANSMNLAKQKKKLKEIMREIGPFDQSRTAKVLHYGIYRGPKKFSASNAAWRPKPIGMPTDVEMELMLRKIYIRARQAMP